MNKSHNGDQKVYAMVSLILQRAGSHICWTCCKKKKKKKVFNAKDLL